MEPERRRRVARRSPGPPSSTRPDVGDAGEIGDQALKDAADSASTEYSASADSDAPIASHEPGNDGPRGQRSGPGRPQTTAPDAHTTRSEHTEGPSPLPFSTPPAAAALGRPEHAADRSLRSLVSTRTTQLSATVAMRAREVAIPTDEELALAEQELVIVRRHYTPPTPLPTGRKRQGDQQRRRRTEGG